MAKPLATAAGGSSAKRPIEDRRGFLSKAITIIAGGVALLVPLASGVFVFFDPLRRNGVLGKLIPVAPLGAVPDDGVPREFPIVAERVDAWNRSLQPVGAVYLRRQPGETKIECLTATCPHAGCFVNYDAQTKTFMCPCHNSQFALDGLIIEPSPSPRPMDSLECQVKNDQVLVKFEDFYSGKADKVVKG
ncbi:MAG: Rieske 2Fe-2S domain-containing protein [Pirellulales bacterium]